MREKREDERGQERMEEDGRGRERTGEEIL